MKLVFVFALLVAAAAAYNRGAAVAYADKWWNSANHDVRQTRTPPPSPFIFFFAQPFSAFSKGNFFLLLFSSSKKTQPTDQTAHTST